MVLSSKVSLLQIVILVGVDMQTSHCVMDSISLPYPTEQKSEYSHKNKSKDEGCDTRHGRSINSNRNRQKKETYDERKRSLWIPSKIQRMIPAKAPNRKPRRPMTGHSPRFVFQDEIRSPVECKRSATRSNPCSRFMMFCSI